VFVIAGDYYTQSAQGGIGVLSAITTAPAISNQLLVDYQTLNNYSYLGLAGKCLSVVTETRRK
jgi:hypothetical protein